MKILSLNLHHHFEVDGFKKLESIAAKIAELDIDIVMLQEMGQYSLSDIKYDDIRYDNNVYYLQKILVEKHGVNYFFYPAIFKSSYNGTYEEGIAVLSKEKLDVASFPVSKNSGFDNWETRFVQEFTAHGIYFYNVHLGWDTEQECFADQLNCILDRSDNKKVLLGDFNQEITATTVGKDFIDPFYEKYVKRVKTWNNEKVIDYCFMNFSCKITCEHLFVEDRVSDHVGLLIDIDVIE